MTTPWPRHIQRRYSEADMVVAYHLGGSSGDAYVSSLAGGIFVQMMRLKKQNPENAPIHTLPK